MILMFLLLSASVPVEHLVVVLWGSGMQAEACTTNEDVAWSEACS
jgi:hypothetical protein